MNKWNILTGVIVFIACISFFASSVYADTEIFYRLVEDHIFDVGNHWQYQIHVTEYPEYGAVDWTGKGVIDVTKTETVSGYDTFCRYTTTTLPVVGTSWSSNNLYLTDDYVMEVKYQNSEERYTLRNNNPFEKLPVWISNETRNYRFGYGQHYGYFHEYDYTWSGYRYSYITYLGNETVNVAAGCFDCTKVLTKEECHEFAGIWGYYENTEWYHPAVGIVKSSEYAYLWNPETSSAITGQLTSGLEVTNVTYPQDFDNDFDVTIADFAILAAAWNTSSGQAGFDSDCDLYQDNTIDLNDIAVFAEKWMPQNWRY